MDKPQVPNDDILDVIELTEKMEEYFQSVLNEHHFHLAVSALVSATINCLFSQCKTVNDLIKQRNVFIEAFDGIIISAKIKDN